MLGKVFEKSVDDVQPISSVVGGCRDTSTPSIVRNLGFPSAKSKLSLAAPRRHKDDGELGGVVLQKPLAGAVNVTDIGTSNRAKTVDELQATNGHNSDENTHVIEAMSKEDRQAALHEVESILSPESIAFLRNRRNQKQQPMQKQSGGNGGIVESKVPHTVDTGVKESSGAGDSDCVTAPGPLATTLEELLLAQKHAPKAVRESLAWTTPSGLEKIAHNTLQTQAIAADFASAKSAQSAPLKDRFDLAGLKLVQPQSMQERIEVCLTALGLSARATSTLAADVYALSCQHLCADSNEVLAEWNASSQPQHPLLQHEFEPQRVGYTIEEAIQMGCSMEMHQRSLAYALLNGLLRRRGTVLALEPYAGRALSNDNGEAWHTYYSVALTEKNESSSSNLEWGFLNLLSQTVDLYRSDGASLAQGPSDALRADICRCLVFALLQATAIDLPSNFPALILTAVQSLRSKTSWLDKLQILQMLSAFLGSAEEEEIAADMWIAAGPWGAHGAPPLMQPHSRRSEMCYEANVLNCVLDRVREQQQEAAAETDSGAAAQPQNVQLVMQCRYGIIDAMVSAGILVPLVDVLVTSLEAVLASKLDFPKGTAGLYEVLSKVAQAALSALAIIIRGGDAGSVEAVMILITRHWSILSRLLVPHESMVLADVQSALLRTCCELCRRAHAFALYLHSKDVLSIVLPIVLSSFSASRSQLASCVQDCVRWAVRLWRTLLGYGLALQGIPELFLAAQIGPPPVATQAGPEHLLASDAVVFVFSVGPGLIVRGETLVQEILLLFEAATVAVAAAAAFQMPLSALPVSSTVAEKAEPESLSERLAELVEVARTLAAAAVGVTQSIITPLLDQLFTHPKQLNPLDNALLLSMQKRAVLAAAVHFLASAVGTVTLGSIPTATTVNISLAKLEEREQEYWCRVYEVSRLRAYGLPAVVAACDTTRSKHMQDARVAMLRQQVLALQSMCSSFNNNFFEVSNIANAAAVECGVRGLELCLARSRLAQGITGGRIDSLTIGQQLSNKIGLESLAAIQRLSVLVSGPLPTVAIGLDAWLTRRKQEMLLVSLLGTTCLQHLLWSQSVCAADTVLNLSFSRSLRETLTEVAGLLGPGMFAPMHTLLAVTISSSHIAACAYYSQVVPADLRLTGLEATENAGLADAVLTGLLGQKDSAFTDSFSLSIDALHGRVLRRERQSGESGMIAERQGSSTAARAAPVEAALADWVLDAHRKQLPLSKRWPLHALYTLSGASFADWMRVVSFNAASNGPGNVGAVELFRVLRLASPEFIHKWLSPTPRTTMQESVVLRSTLNSATLEPFVPEAFPQAIAAYCVFVEQLSFRVARASLDVAAPGSGLRELCLAASQEMEFSASGVLAATAAEKRPRLLPTSAASFVGARGAGVGPVKPFNENGALELAGKLLESAVGQHIAPSVHAIAIGVLLCPLLMPWRVRERVWRELGQYGLLHLVDLSRNDWSPLLVLSSCCAAPSRISLDTGSAGAQGGELLVAKSALTSIVTMRGGRTNRQLPVYAVALCTITQLLSTDVCFNPVMNAQGRESSSNSKQYVVRGRAVRLLSDIVSPFQSLQCPDWLVLDVLAFLLVTSPDFADMAAAQASPATLTFKEAQFQGQHFWQSIDAAFLVADDGPEALWQYRRKTVAGEMLISSAGAPLEGLHAEAENWIVDTPSDGPLPLLDFVMKLRPSVVFKV